MMRRPTPDRIKEIILDSFYKDLPPGSTEKDLPEDAIIAQGVMAKMAFDPERIEKHRREIAEMLTHFPEQFYEDTGGGWSFSNLCYTKDGTLWTGLQQDMDVLCMLSIALGLGNFLLDRGMWAALPGGVPYFVIRSNAVAKALNLPEQE